MIIVYAPDGTPHRCHPIDARELMETQGYTKTQGGQRSTNPSADVRQAVETGDTYEFPDLNDADQVKAMLTQYGIRFHPNNKLETLAEKVVEYERSHGHQRPNAPQLPENESN